MTSYKKTIDSIHSRLKNDLLENQAWWPVTLKHGGEQGFITIDPVLYRSELNDASELALASSQEHANESKYAGIRVEYLLTNAAKSAQNGSEGTCTIQIQNSGTWDAQAIITWPDATTTTIALVSEALSGKHLSTDRHDPLDAKNTALLTAGPAPVPMTLQEFADILDTFTKRDGAFANETPSGREFNPHPNNHEYIVEVGGVGTQDTPVDYSLIPSLSNFLGTEAGAQIAATIFMPMCMNVNQFSRNMSAINATTLHASQLAPDGGNPATDELLPATNERGMSRYDPDPEGTDSASIEYAFANQFGDHRYGHRRIGNANDYTVDYVDSADNGLAPNPKWRTRMCLAMFLKDGTYTISGGGALIPYIYDSRREIGGEHWLRSRGQHAANGCYLGGDGLYGVWQPSSRSGEALSGAQYAFAGFLPGVDFVQGPFSNPAHGWNTDIETIYPSIYGDLLEGGFTLGSTDIYAYEYAGAINPMPVPVYGVKLDSGTFSIYVDSAEIPVSHIGVGAALYITEIDGDLGWGAAKDCNGWWLIDSVTTGIDGDSPSGNGARFDCLTNYAGTVAKYAPIAAFVRQGRPKPVVPSTNTNALPTDASQSFFGGDTPSNHGYSSSLFGTVDDLRPGLSSATSLSNRAGGDGYDEEFRRDLFSRRQIQVTGKSNYPSEIAGDLNPTPTMTGGMGIRLPPMLGDHGQLGERYSNSVWANIENTEWFTKGLLLSLWSGIDGETGRHAWDYIRPQDSSGNQWVKGRNRPFPPKRRAGSMYSSAPSSFDVTGLYTDAYVDANIDDSPEYGVPTDKYGLTEWGVSPIFADIEIKAFIPKEQDRITKIWFERGEVIKGGWGQRAFKAYGPTSMLGRSDTTQTSQGWGHYPVIGESFSHSINGETIRFNKYDFTTADAWWWAWGGSAYLENTNIINQVVSDGGSMPFQGLRTAWGLASNHIGTGGSSNSFDEGLHKLRFVFHKEGMTHLFNDSSQGTDASCQGPVFGFTFEHGALHVPNTAITEGVFSNLVNPTGKDPVIDTITVREILTPQSLPCYVETVTYTFANVAKITSLELTGENMTANQYVRVTVCSPGSTSGSWDGFGQGAGTPLADFTSLDPVWAGGYGSINLVDLPSSALSTGLTLRFEFTIPTNEDISLLPLDWTNMPRITSWEFIYDEKPSATLAVIGETFSGDLTSPIDTRVGHIVSYRIGGTTTDSDRIISYVKIDYGDGKTTEWLAVDAAADSIEYDISHSYTSSDSGLLARAKVKDDNGNESDWSSTITINVSNAPPTAILRATPSLVRAGDSVRLDASKSFDIEEGGTVTNFTFNAGDGSSAIGPQSSTYTSHTYADAGEYMATMTCEDSDGTTSNTARAIIKVLPARLTIPLVLNTMPSSFTRSRSAQYTITSLLDTDFPEVSDSGQRSDEFVLQGTFLTSTGEADIDFMEDLLSTGHLVEFEWQAVNYQGTPDSRTFVGRVTSFSYSRQGGEHGQTPWSATLIREAGVGQ